MRWEFMGIFPNPICKTVQPKAITASPNQAEVFLTPARYTPPAREKQVERRGTFVDSSGKLRFLEVFCFFLRMINRLGG